MSVDKDEKIQLNIKMLPKDEKTGREVLVVDQRGN